MLKEHTENWFKSLFFLCVIYNNVPKSNDANISDTDSHSLFILPGGEGIIQSWWRVYAPKNTNIIFGGNSASLVRHEAITSIKLYFFGPLA